MTQRPNASVPNLLLLIETHGPGFLSEVDEEITDLRARLELAVEKRERIRAILAVHQPLENAVPREVPAVASLAPETEL